MKLLQSFISAFVLALFYSRLSLATDPSEFIANLGAQMPGSIQNVLKLALMGENYIVVLQADIALNKFLDHVDWLSSRLAEHPQLGSIIHKYDIAGDHKFYGYAGTFHPKLLQYLKALPLVSFVCKDDTASIGATSNVSQGFSTYTEVPAPWGLTRIWQRTRPSSYTPQLSPFVYNYNRGTNVDAYILDTGVYIEHTEFGGRAKRGPIYGPDTNAGDENGHGSHVAGIVGGSTYGVAKNVNIIDMKVLGKNGSGPWSGIIAALNFAVKRAQALKRASVVNISISGSTNDAVSAAIAAALSAGVHVVVAAGNSNANACLSSPSSAKGLIVVGSVGQSDAFSSFSNWGTCVTLSAPGEVIPSVGIANNKAVQYMSGTSMASPHVTGSVSVILSMRSVTPAAMLKYMSAYASNVVTNTRTSPSRLLYLSPQTIPASAFV